MGKTQPTRQHLAAVLGLAILCTAGCGHDTWDEQPIGTGISRTAGKGPVWVTLSATPAKLEFKQRVQLLVEIIAEKGITVLESEYESSLGEGDRRFEYRVVRTDLRAAQPTDDGKLRWTYRFDLEFFLPGEYELPGAEISFVGPSMVDGDRVEESAAAAPAEVQRVETEPLTIVVRPPEGVALSEAELRTLIRLDPVELPGVWSRWWWLSPVVVILVVIVAVLLARRARRSQPDLVVRIPPYEWARRQIATLIGEDLIAKGRVQEFYYRISGILRGYIERRFSLSAPEMTTEEFLASAASDDRFGGDVTAELDRFLGACDLVKYARHEPGPQESDSVLKAANDFVERTRQQVSKAEEQRVLTRVELRAG